MNSKNIQRRLATCLPLVMMLTWGVTARVAAQAQQCPPGQVLGSPGHCVWRCLCPDGQPSVDCVTCPAVMTSAPSPEWKTNGQMTPAVAPERSAGASEPRGASAERLCADQMDDDGDTLIDCNDPDCQSVPGACKEAYCSNRRDDDADGLIDCSDPDCATDVACAVAVAEPCSTVFVSSGETKDGSPVRASGGCAGSGAAAAARCVFASNGKVSDLLSKYVKEADSKDIPLKLNKLKLVWIDASGKYQSIDAGAGELHEEWTELFSKSWLDIWIERLKDAVAADRPDQIESHKAKMDMDVVCGNGVTGATSSAGSRE